MDLAPSCHGSSGPPPADAETDEITVQELRRALADPGLGVRVLDIREPFEARIARLDGVPLLPLSELAARCAELDPRQTYYLLCHVGVRSRHATAFLKARGFRHVKSVRGGIAAWSAEIDPAVPRY